MTNIRAELERLMRATVADETAHKDWAYRDVRPMPVPAGWHPGQTVVGDCSKGVQYLCRWAGGPDPMHEAWGPWGNSQTLWLRQQHLDSAAELEPGDMVTFGVDGSAHATMVLEAGPDPLLWSFGHQGSPNLYRLSQDGRPAQFLRYPVPDYVPTEIAKLRARTGWFAWVAWRLGEGDWHPYGAAAVRVRPKVPRRIPAAWWARYLLFMANRRHGG